MFGFIVSYFPFLLIDEVNEGMPVLVVAQINSLISSELLLIGFYESSEITVVAIRYNWVDVAIGFIIGIPKKEVSRLSNRVAEVL